ncbi:unnamed protein product [Rotaria socialis]|uniref:Transposase n=3 Tax=Rotaria socialis TaxID=392032 RepID=A0A818STH5_9BILA|nr:unnamed protein product [Rotaria socialis]CAF3677409.1 unnamed protein product [Rotaria socialis]
MTNTNERFFNLLNILSFRAARLIVTFEQCMPACLVPRKTSFLMKERNEFARALIQQELGESYSSEQILHCRNIINANDISKIEMGVCIDLEDAINRFKLIHPTHPYIQDLNTLSLVPFRTQCNNFRDGIECGDQLRLDFHMTAFIIYPTSIRSCTMYSANCKKCQLSYRVSSIYCMNEQKIIVTPEAIEKKQYFHLSSGKLVYSRELLVSVSSDLVNGHISFNGAGTSLLSKVTRIHPEFDKKFDPAEFTRSLEAHWLYFELFNLIFMTSAEKKVVIPRALFSARNIVKGGGMINAKAQFLEEHLNWIYNLFSIFWSHHKLIPDCQCDSSACSRVLILDGHQKPRRTVCSFDNVTSLMNEDELGVCNRGCPYQPQKRKKDEKRKNKTSPYYCFYHQNLSESVSANVVEDRQRDQAWEDDLKLLEKDDLTHDYETCNVVRSQEDEELENKRKSMGFLASFLSCGIVIGFTESINHEGARKVTDHLLTMIKMGSKIPDAMIYDSACTLKLFWTKNYRNIHLKETAASKILFEMRIAVDRFHHKNHVHSMCKTITNPDCTTNGNYEAYQGINTGIAEQSFRYLSEFKLSLRRLAYPTSTIFSILLLHLWNCRRVQISPDCFGLAMKYIPDKIKPLFRTYCIFETAQLSSNKILTDSMDLTQDEEQNDEIVEMTLGVDHLEQLDYDCCVNLEEYAWDSDQE